MAALAAGATYPHDLRMASRHERFWLLGALLFGVVALPWFVYATGLYLLGQYAGGGAGAYFVDFLRGLLTLRWYSWSLALGPLLIVALWRGLWRISSSRA